ncbi:MAG TPA: type II toxin-antitoxin system VapC family toxin [Syntrophales bacterium]|nr:type II toxin-antitoxin system VapC family toxin [Syntrophales bacterium]
MIRYMLDTNTCIAIIKRRPDTIQTRLIALAVEEVGISGIVVAELWYGVAFSQKKKQNETALKDFLDYVTVLDWPFEAGEIYGRIRADLKGKGTPIGAMDLLIASHALFLDAVLVTDNVREFQRVSDLKIENWVF